MSAARRKLGSDLCSADHGCYILGFSFLGNRGINPNVTTFRGDYLTSVTRTAVGRYLCEVQVLGLQIICGSVMIESPSGALFHGCVELINNTGTLNQIVINTFNAAGAPLDMDITDRVHAWFQVRRNAVTVRRNLI